MGLSRRQFTKEFKLAALQRLERGGSVAEVARAFEVNPNVLHRWRREFRRGPGNVFPGLGKRRWEEGRVAQLERKIGQQALEIDFLKGCLQRIDEQRKRQALTAKPLSTGRSSPEGRRRRLDAATNVHFGCCQPSGVLPVCTPLAGGRTGLGIARRHAADCPGVSQLRLAADHSRTQAAWLEGESQKGLPLDAPGQSAMPTEEEVRGHDRF